MKIGFTGTREGMSQSQKEEFILNLYRLCPTEFHHGDCEGADEEAHDIIREFFPDTVIHVYPPASTYRQAYKQGDVHYAPEEYLLRDKRIVNSSEHLIGAPLLDNPTTRSGSWATIRYAKSREIPVTVLAR
jgi:hypothetical protein